MACSSNVAPLPPDPRVQGVRRSAGARAACMVAAAFLVLLALGCDKDSPTQPSRAVPLSGRWSADISGRICVGDWSAVILELHQDGTALTGTVTTRDSQTFPVSGSIQNDSGTLDVSISGTACSGISLVIFQVERNSLGQPMRFSGEARGRCCGTLMQEYRFLWVSAA